MGLLTGRFRGNDKGGRNRFISWIPAFAGMTVRGRNESINWIPAFAGMTASNGNDDEQRE